MSGHVAGNGTSLLPLTEAFSSPKSRNPERASWPEHAGVLCMWVFRSFSRQSPAWAEMTLTHRWSH